MVALSRTLVLLALLGGMLSPQRAAAQASPAVVTGMVLEFGSRTALAGAVVEIDGAGRVETNREGGFRFGRVVTGLRTVTVTAFGYAPRSLMVDLRGDTALVVEMDVAPLALDSIAVRSRLISVRGRVTDRATGRSIVPADITISPGRDMGPARSVEGNMVGSFRVNRVPGGFPVDVVVSALGYLPFVATITADRDTTLDVKLGRDDVAERMVERQVSRLESRFRANAFRRDHYDREELQRRPGFTAYELIRQRLGRDPSAACVFIDDQERAAGNEMLKSYLSDELQRIEILDRGVMIRIYTRRHMQKLFGNAPLQPFVLIKGLGQVICK